VKGEKSEKHHGKGAFLKPKRGTLSLRYVLEKILVFVQGKAIFGLLSLPFFWLTFFLLAPLLIMVLISFSESVIAIPPYTALFSWAEHGILTLKVSFLNYLFVFAEALYALAYLNSFALGLTTTVLCVLIAYPLAYVLVQIEGKWRFIFLVLLMLPFWISFLVRVYAWIGLLSPHSLLSDFVAFLGLIPKDTGLIGTHGGVLIGMVYTYLPFMVLPLYTALEKIDISLVEAASDLGARPLKVFFRIILPLSWRGGLTGATLVFIPVVGEFAIPELLGGQKTLMIGQMIWNEFFYNRDWPLASALAMCMLLTLVPPILMLARIQKNDTSDAKF